MELQPETLYYLKEVMAKASLNRKKGWLRDLFEGMIWRVAHEIPFGSLDPGLIEIYDDRAYLPQEDAELTLFLHEPYLFSLKSFVIEFHASDYPRMSQRERLEYDDFVSFLGTLSTLRQLKLLRYHPHLQTRNELHRFLKTAKEQVPGVTASKKDSPTMELEIFRYYWLNDGRAVGALGAIDLCSVIGTMGDPGGYESNPMLVRVFQVGRIYCWLRGEVLAEGEAERIGARTLEIYVATEEEEQEEEEDIIHYP